MVQGVEYMVQRVEYRVHAVVSSGYMLWFCTEVAVVVSRGNILRLGIEVAVS